MSSSGGRRVVLVVGIMRRYRVRFFDLLRTRLSEANVKLDVVYSTPTGVNAGRGDTVDLSWAYHVDEHVLRFGPYELLWQPCLDIVRDADLVVVEQATRRPLNYLLLAMQAWGGPRLAFWGHGRNFKATTRIHSVSEAVKRFLSQQGHWFFAYTDISAEAVKQLGYPQDRITRVGNSIDTRSLSEARERVTQADKSELREQLGLRGDNVGIYCGAMYPTKDLPFLIQAAREIRARITDFELICVGSGVDRDVVEGAARDHGWIHPVGPQFGDDLARHFALARVLLIPRGVGLAILDSFVFEVPLVTTRGASHGPEIAYLEDGVNGLIAGGNGSVEDYAMSAVDLLTDDSLHSRLVDGCKRSARSHEAEAMVDRFAEGVMGALAAPVRGRFARLLAR